MSENELAFEIRARIDGKSVTFIAERDGQAVTSASYKPGNAKMRVATAKSWSMHEGLHNGYTPTPTQVRKALEAAELRAIAVLDEANVGYAGCVGSTEAPGHVNSHIVAELAYNLKTGAPDFIVYDRASGAVTRSDKVDIGGGFIVPPTICKGIVTPGHPVEGCIYVPTDCDPAKLDTAKLRRDVRAFIHRYVELPPGGECVATEYVLLTYDIDDFDELPYTAFETPDAGRGKSRAIETVGSLCYRPMFMGGGSSAAATRRLIDTFRGTLIADEFDNAADTELTSTLTKILNQGFQRNRPLVSCDGDKNEPRAFVVFGPKVFALRKGFADDATKSRTISIRMQQRTRSDIPLNLPRAQFDREARELRNRLLAWRFLSVGTLKINPKLADRELEDRANQIGLPLLAVALPESRPSIIAALRGAQDDVAADRSMSFEATVFEHALSAAFNDVVRPVDVANSMNQARAMEQGLVDAMGNADVSKLRNGVPAWKVGNVMAKELALPRESRDSKGVKYRLSPVRVAELKKRFGITDTPDNSPPSLFPSVNPPSDPTHPTLDEEEYNNNTINIDDFDSVGFSVGGSVECRVNADFPTLDDGEALAAMDAETDDWGNSTLHSEAQ